MKKVLIGGIGNVLLGDDAVGPYVVRLLESQYSFGEDVATADLGTPALDLTHQIVGLRALILVDAISNDDAPGTVVLYRKQDILSAAPNQRLDPHSPALSECLLAAELLGASPEHVLLVGIVGEQYKPGKPFSEPVRQSLGRAVQVIIQELERLGFTSREKTCPDEPDIWWVDDQALDSELVN